MRAKTSRTVPEVPSTDTRWPLVGRARELETIARALDDAGGVVIVAPPGVGKSRLAREAFAAARTAALAEWVQATTSAAAVPLGAFAALVPDHARSDEATAVMARSAEILTERAQGRRIVLAVDDAQLLDPVSAALVLHLVSAEGVRVLATVRSGSPLPDAITSLWKDAGAVRLDLEAFDDATARSLAEQALGGPLDESTAHWLLERGQGNALFLSELLLGAVDSGALALVAGVWRLLREPQLSPTLRDLVHTRLGALPAGRRAVLELLALGEPLGLDELSGLAEPDAIVDAEARGLVEVDAQDEVRLAHPLFGDAVRDAVSRLRARHLRLALAETLARRLPLTGADTLRVVRLRLDAGAEIPGELRLTAARAANLAGDPELGTQLAQLALDEGGELPAAMLLARAHTLCSRHTEAEAVLAAAEPLAAASEDRFDYLRQRVWVLQWGLRHPQAALALIERAGAWSSAPEWAKRVEYARLEASIAFRDIGGAARAAEELDDETQRKLESLRVVELLLSGQGDRAAAIARRLDPPIPFRDVTDAITLGTRGWSTYSTGNDWPQHLEYLTRTLARALRAGDHQAAGAASLGLGAMAYMGGRYLDAARWTAEAELHFAHQDALRNLVHVHHLRVAICFFSGDGDGALTSLAAMEAELGSGEPLAPQLPYVLRARGWAARVRSDAEAVTVFCRAADQLVDEAPIFAAELSYEALRAGGQVAPQLTQLASRGQTRLVSAFAAHAQARADRDGAALLEAAGELAAIGARPYASECAADAAEAFLLDGRRSSAHRAAFRAREWHVPDQGARPPRVDGLESPAIELTVREQQIVDLASRGQTNVEIANQLVLSVRTVESHLYHAMQKLGVTDRRALRT